MASEIGPRGTGRLIAAFPNLQVGATSAPFSTNGGGLMEVQFQADDVNNPGTCTLQDASGTALATVTTSMGDVPGYTGSIFYYAPAAATYSINTTQLAKQVQVFHHANGF